MRLENITSDLYVLRRQIYFDESVTVRNINFGTMSCSKSLKNADRLGGSVLFGGRTRLSCPDRAKQTEMFEMLSESIRNQGRLGGSVLFGGRTRLSCPDRTELYLYIYFYRKLRHTMILTEIAADF